MGRYKCPNGRDTQVSSRGEAACDAEAAGGPLEERVRARDAHDISGGAASGGVLAALHGAGTVAAAASAGAVDNTAS